MKKDAAAAETASHNVWQERREFYNSAVPRDSAEEQQMLDAALELSKLEQRKMSLRNSLSSVLLVALSPCVGSTVQTQTQCIERIDPLFPVRMLQKVLLVLRPIIGFF